MSVRTDHRLFAVDDNVTTHGMKGLRPSDAQTVILVVDDEEILRFVASAVLRKQGYVVLTASDGEEALSISRQFLGPIDVVLTDIVMPNMDGVELRRRIIEERPTTKVLLMSAYAPPLFSDTSILKKPFSFAILKERIHQLVNEAH